MNVPFKKQFKTLLLSGFMLFSSAVIFAQQGTIKGTVTDANGEPIIGATVFIEGTTQGTVSDVSGNYVLPNLPEGSVVIAVNFVGFLKETKTITVTANVENVVDFMLIEDLQQLSEVVVIGYGTVKKKDLTGAVSSIKPEELTKLATTNVQQAIQGRVAGVMVTTNSGAPGDNVSVRIRGISSVNNSDPLYVVDGFPTGSIGYLNPSDIESMEVLKDASATAIYGNRGATGVILITTKKGKEQKSTITFSTYVGTLQANKTIPVLNAMEYAEAKYMAYDNLAEIRNRPRLALTGSGSALDDTLQWVLGNNYEGTNWQDKVLRKGVTQNYELGVSGGNEKYTYNVSGGFNREDGIIIGSWQKRYNLRYAGQAEINKYVKSSFSLAYRNYERINYDASLYGQGVLPNALVGDPISPVYLSDTNWYAPVDISQTWNPVAAADRAINNRNKADQVVGNLGVDIEIIKGLVFSSKFGGDLNWNRTKRYIPVYAIGAKDLSTQSSLDEIYQRTFGWNNSNFINYNKTINKLDFNLMVGQEWSSFNNFRLRYVVYDVPNNQSLFYPHLSGTATFPDFNGDFSSTNRPAYETRLFSFFGRAFFGYNDRYLLTVNYRRDAASQIAKEYRWGKFPSFSLGWNIKNEGFMKNVAPISTLKLRYGWGKTGNIGSLYDPYARFAVITPGLNIVGPGDLAASGGIQTINPSKDLQWEEVTQSNYAVDFGFMQNKINGTVDYYTKQTSGMIIRLNPPFFAGSLASEGNYGKMESWGLEFSLNYRNYDGEFKYEIGGNITKMSHPIITQWGDPWLDGSAGKVANIVRTEEGEEVAQFYGFKTDGLLTQEDIDNSYVVNGADTTFTYDPSDNWFWYPGQLKIVDLDGDGEITDEDKTNIGSANPDLFYGLNLNFIYKGIDLLLFFQGVYGNELINGINVWSKIPDEGDNNLSTDVLDAWTPENTNTDVPRLVQSNPIMQQYFNDYLVEDASYFRLKNVQIGYTLPQSVLGKVGISNLRIYVSAENWFTLTKYSGFDPEVGSLQFNSSLQRSTPLSAGIDQAGYPIAKKILLGLNITF
jgi:TonB-dependent starch-binding outer membrane protein SusC